ncbi:hypothetical protein Dimus_001272, partial [Dionaea muscipula]
PSNSRQQQFKCKHEPNRKQPIRQLHVQPIAALQQQPACIGVEAIFNNNQRAAQQRQQQQAQRPPSFSSSISRQSAQQETAHSLPIIQRSNQQHSGKGR